MDLSVGDQVRCAGLVPFYLGETAQSCRSLFDAIDILSDIEKRLHLSVVIALLITLTVVWYTRRFTNRLIHVRGRQQLVGKEAHDYIRAFSGNECRNDKGAIKLLDWLTISSIRQGIHCAVIGGSGSGKTQTLLLYLFWALKARHKAVIHDVKGDFTSYIEDAILLAPADARSSIWDIGKDIDTRPLAVDLATYLIPAPAGQKDPFWSNASRAMLVGYITKLQSERGSSWGWHDLAEVILYDADAWTEVLKEYAPEALEYVENSGSNLSVGVRADLKSNFSLVADIANAWGMNTEGRHFVSLRDWMQDNDPEKRVVIIQNNEEIKKQSELIIGAFFNYVTKFSIGPRRSKKSTPVWFFLDELNSMSKQHEVTNLINLGREKKCYAFIGAQAISALYEKYTPHEIDVWFNSIGTLWIGKHGHGTNADKAAGLAGRRQVERHDVSAGYAKGTGNASENHGYRGEMQNVMMASELTASLGFNDKPFEHIKISVLGFGETLCVVDIPITKVTPKREAFVEATWMKAGEFKAIRSPELEALQKKRKDKKKKEQEEKRQLEAEAQAHANAGLTEKIVAETSRTVLKALEDAANGENDNNEPEAPPKKSAAELKREREERMAANVAEELVDEAAQGHYGGSISKTVEAFAEKVSTPAEVINPSIPKQQVPSLPAGKPGIKRLVIRQPSKRANKS